MRYFFAAVLLVASTAWADTASVGPNGVNSKATGLDGTGIEIGEVDNGRSAKNGYDSDDLTDPNNPILRVASNTIPKGVYVGPSGNINAMDAMNSPNIDIHATEVAEIMIGSAGPQEGVAPFADLYSAATGGLDTDAALVFNRLIKFSGTNIRMRAMNVSFGREAQEPIEKLDGQSYITQFVDWSASHQDVTYVFAWGNSDSPSARVPQDNFNGIKVAASEKPMNENVFRQFSINTNANTGDPFGGNRSGIDILAPGRGINVLDPGDVQVQVGGSSIAAPHVTGAVALLQQYAEQQMNLPTPNPRFTAGSQRHEVMKAVLLNSADKLAGVHDSTRTVIDAAGNNWLQSPAFASDFISLDKRMGAGALNANSAKKQYVPGEYDPGNVPSLGWDYGTNGGQGARNEYILNQGGDGYIAVTLTWDRRINNPRGDNTYQEGDFYGHYNEVTDVLNNLNVYILPVGDDDLGHAVAASFASEDNVEHIFANIGAGNFKIVVTNEPNGIGDSQNYGIAWWYGNASPPGDYNKNGSVGPEDYDVWRQNFGTTNADADGNGNGVVDAADYVVWRKNLGAGSGASLASAPEPCSLSLLTVASILFGACTKGPRRR